MNWVGRNYHNYYHFSAENIPLKGCVLLIEQLVNGEVKVWIPEIQLQKPYHLTFMLYCLLWTSTWILHFSYAFDLLFAFLKLASLTFILASNSNFDYKINLFWVWHLMDIFPPPNPDSCSQHVIHFLKAELIKLKVIQLGNRKSHFQIQVNLSFNPVPSFQIVLPRVTSLPLLEWNRNISLATEKSKWVNIC